MDGSKEKRLFRRYIVQKQAAFQVSLWLTDTKTKRRKQYLKDIIDIGSGGLSFASNLTDDIFTPGTFLEKIEIFSQGNCWLRTSGEVKHIVYALDKAAGYAYKIGVEFEVEFTNEDCRYKANSWRRQERILDFFRIFDNLKTLIEKAIPVSLEDIDSHYPAISGYFTQLTDSDKFYTLTFEPVSLHLTCRLFEEFNRVQAVYQYNANGYKFASVVIARDRHKIILKFPNSIDYLWQRSTLRYVPPYGFLKIQFTHPLLGGIPLSYRVIDLTPQGISFITKYPNDLLVKGMSIPRVSLLIPGERRISAAAIVKYISMAIDEQRGSYFKCGLNFEGLSQGDTDFLVSYLLEKCYPHLKDARGERVEAIWDFFSEAGFIYEEKRKFLAPVVAEVSDTFRKLLEPDTRFYKKIVCKENERYYGAVSGIRAYEHTWIIQHLAVTRYSRRFLSKDIVLAIADFCTKHPDVGYQIIYWRPNNSWSDKVFGKYARQVADKTDLSNLVCYDYLLKSPLEDYQEVYIPAGVTVEPLTADDCPLIEGYFIARRELIILQAHSLLRDEIELPHIRQMYRQKGLRRERQVYLAKSGQTFLGFVLIEDSSMGTNLSGLLNHFKVYTTPECAGMEAEIRRALARKAIEYYKSQGRHFALCLSPNEDSGIYGAMGFKKKKEYLCWTISQKLAQSYFNFVNDFFARIEARMERNREEIQENDLEKNVANLT